MKPMVRLVGPYDYRAGCLVVPVGRKCAVVDPLGRVLSLHDDEREARAAALHHTTTATEEDIQEWRPIHAHTSRIIGQ
jgi:hypothetical protein